MRKHHADHEERVDYYGFDPCVVVEAWRPEDALRAAGYSEQLDNCEWDEDDSADGEVTFSHSGCSSKWDAWTLVVLGPFRRCGTAHSAMEEWRERHSEVIPFGH